MKERVQMTRAIALFMMIYPGKEETKSISLSNGRKLGCRIYSDTSYTVGTYRQGPLYEWFYLTPTVVEGRVIDVTAVDREGNPDGERQKEWESYADHIISLLSESKKKKLELLVKQTEF